MPWDDDWDDKLWDEYEAGLRRVTPTYTPAAAHGPPRPKALLGGNILSYYPRRTPFESHQAVKPWHSLPAPWPEYARCTSVASGGRYIQFDPYLFQKRLIHTIRNHQNTYVLKSRQTGISETVISYMAQQAIMHRGWTGIVFSKTGDDASELAARIKGQVASLRERCPPMSKDSMRKLVFDGAGSLHFLPPTARAARGIPSASFVLFDEAAFIGSAGKDALDGIETGALPALSLLGERARAVWVSTPNGRSGKFHERWSTDNGEVQIGDQVINGIPVMRRCLDGSFAKMAIHWTHHPIYSQDPDYPEKVKKKFQYTDQKYRQEFELDFTATDAEVYAHELIAAAEAIGGFCLPRRGHEYVCGIDPNGGADDEWVTTILDVTESPWQVVACFHDSRKSRDYGLQHTARLMDQYNPSLICVEKNGVGAAVAESLNILRPGFDIQEISTSGPSKLLMTDRIVLLLEQHELGIPADGIYGGQMKTFRQDEKGKREAASGQRDDAVMSLAMACQAGAIARPLMGSWIKFN